MSGTTHSVSKPKGTSQSRSSLEQLASGAGIAFVLSMVGFGLMFVFKLFAARHFGPHDFGVFSLLETVLGLTALVAGLGLTGGLSRYVPYYKERKEFGLLKGYIRFVSVLGFASGFVVGGLVYIFASQITAFFGFPLEFVRFLQILGFTVPFIVVDNVFRRFFIASKKVGYQRFSTQVLEKGVFLLGLALIWLFELGLVWLVVTYIAGKFLPLVFDSLMFKRLWTVPKGTVSSFAKKEWFYFSLPLLFTGMFAFVIRWTDNLVVGRVMTPESLGVYSIVFSFVTLLSFFQRSFIPMFMPIITEHHAKGDSSHISFLFRKSSAWVFGLSLPIALLMIVYGKQLLVLLYGESYAVGHLPLMILAVGFLINVGSGLGNQIIMMHKKTKYLFYVNVGVALLNLGLNISLIPVLGLEGAALSSAVSMGLQNILYFRIARRFETLSFDWRYYFKFLVAGLPAAFIARYIFHFGLNKILAVVLSLGVYAGLYLFLLLLMRTFTKEDFKVLLMFEKRLHLNLKFIKKIVMRFY
ncbi:MAG: flippase [Candidatus Woesearchaeota archaeon]